MHSLESNHVHYKNLHSIFKGYWLKEAKIRNWLICIKRIEHVVVFLYFLVSIVEIFLSLLPASTKVHLKSQ